MSARNVLIVEDLQDQAQGLSLLLQMLGLKSEWVGTKASALARLAIEPKIDCVILDLTLPDARNLEAQQALQFKFPNIPVIIYTGFQELVVPSIHAGAMDVVIKPGTSDPKEWEYRIEKAIALIQVRQKYKPYLDALMSVKENAEKRAAGGAPECEEQK